MPPTCQRWMDVPEVATPQRVGPSPDGAVSLRTARLASSVRGSPMPTSHSLPGAQITARSPSASTTALGQPASRARARARSAIQPLPTPPRSKRSPGGRRTRAAPRGRLVSCHSPRREGATRSFLPSAVRRASSSVISANPSLASAATMPASNAAASVGRTATAEFPSAFSRARSESSVCLVSRAAHRSMRAIKRRASSRASAVRPSASRCTSKRPPIEAAVQVNGTIERASTASRPEFARSGGFRSAREATITAEPSPTESS